MGQITAGWTDEDDVLHTVRLRLLADDDVDLDTIEGSGFDTVVIDLIAEFPPAAVQ